MTLEEFEQAMRKEFLHLDFEDIAKLFGMPYAENLWPWVYVRDHQEQWDKAWNEDDLIPQHIKDMDIDVFMAWMKLRG